MSGAHCAKVWTAGEISMTAVGAKSLCLAAELDRQETVLYSGTRI